MRYTPHLSNISICEGSISSIPKYQTIGRRGWKFTHFVVICIQVCNHTINICSIHNDSSPWEKKNISGSKIHADSYFLRQMRGGLTWFEYQRKFMEFYGKIPSHQVTRRSCRDGSFAWSPPPFFTFPPFEDDNMMPERCKVSD